MSTWRDFNIALAGGNFVCMIFNVMSGSALLAVVNLAVAAWIWSTRNA